MKAVRFNSGFTLIEILVGIGIIGILGVIALPRFGSLRQQNYDIEAVTALKRAAIAQEEYFKAEKHFVTCSNNMDCSTKLTKFKSSSDIVLKMTRVPATHLVPEHFTAVAYHPKGLRNDVTKAFEWNSQFGGLQ